jgi:hypothetical protein
MVFGQYQFQTSTPNILSATWLRPPKSIAETVSLGQLAFFAFSITQNTGFLDRFLKKSIVL